MKPAMNYSLFIKIFIKLVRISVIVYSELKERHAYYKHACMFNKTVGVKLSVCREYPIKSLESKKEKSFKD